MPCGWSSCNRRRSAVGSATRGGDRAGLVAVVVAAADRRRGAGRRSETGQRACRVKITAIVPVPRASAANAIPSNCELDNRDAIAPTRSKAETTKAIICSAIFGFNINRTGLQQSRRRTLPNQFPRIPNPMPIQEGRQARSRRTKYPMQQKTGPLQQNQLSPRYNLEGCCRLDPRSSPDCLRHRDTG